MANAIDLKTNPHGNVKKFPIKAIVGAPHAPVIALGGRDHFAVDLDVGKPGATCKDATTSGGLLGLFGCALRPWGGR